ncbi:trfA protein [Planctomycetales bacterium]|nr:trfA protein [Planctomycetales bacterium]
MEPLEFSFVSGTEPRIAAFYLDYLHQHDLQRFLNQVNQYYTQPALLKICCSQHLNTRRAAAHILGFIGDYEANPQLGKMLNDSDRSVQLLAEASIKHVWTRFGNEQERRELRTVMRMISNQEYAEAIRVANILLETAPLFAEARNQRAIALFAVGDFQNAVEDTSIVLDLNPFHFGAAVGMGHSYLQLGNKDLAAECFRHALQINPCLESARCHLLRIEQQNYDR